VRGRLGRLALGTYAGMVICYLLLPIAVMVIFSFNKPIGRKNYEWNQFSLDAWKDPFRYPEFKEAFITSLWVATIATVIAVFFGTGLALALVKYRFKGKGLVNTLVVMPLTMPEIVLGFSLLSLFVFADVRRGFRTIVIAHVMFCVSYVATTAKARIRGFEWRLEEAAADLGAGPIRTFMKVTLPIIAPGILVAALLTFALSLDDFTITYLNSGNEVTFPMQVWLSKRSVVPPQINVFGTMILFVAVVLSIAAMLGSARARKRYEGA